MYLNRVTTDHINCVSDIFSKSEPKVWTQEGRKYNAPVTVEETEPWERELKRPSSRDLSKQTMENTTQGLRVECLCQTKPALHPVGLVRELVKERA